MNYGTKMIEHHFTLKAVLCNENVFVFGAWFVKHSRQHVSGRAGLQWSQSSFQYIQINKGSMCKHVLSVLLVQES
jgi:hypothetical protein